MRDRRRRRSPGYARACNAAVDQARLPGFRQPRSGSDSVSHCANRAAHQKSTIVSDVLISLAATFQAGWRISCWRPGGTFACQIVARTLQHRRGIAKGLVGATPSILGWRDTHCPGSRGAVRLSGRAVGLAFDSQAAAERSRVHVAARPSFAGRRRFCRPFASNGCDPRSDAMNYRTAAAAVNLGPRATARRRFQRVLFFVRLARFPCLERKNG
jgi:hypothetical protein